jgi:hypothetical protein
MGKRTGKKRERRRVPKEERKNLRLWAEGEREKILTPHIDAYTVALNQGWRLERKYLKSVCNEFDARVSWRLPDHEEPVLGEWDPTAVVPQEQLSEMDEQLKRTRIKELNAVSHGSSHVTVQSAHSTFSESVDGSCTAFDDSGSTGVWLGWTLPRTLSPFFSLSYLDCPPHPKHGKHFSNSCVSATTM